MRPLKNEWPTSDGARNTMFVAQAMLEMLARDAFESFRAPTLDTLSRTQEVEFLATQIQEKRVKPITIVAAIEEICWSIKNDPIAANFLKDECDELASKIEKLGSPTPSQTKNIVSQMRTFSRRLRPLYSKELNEEFVALFVNNNKRNYALKICQTFVSHLINSGYDRRYIYATVFDRFCSSDIKKIEKRTLSRFLNAFDYKERNYQVYLSVSDESHKFVEIISVPAIRALRASEMPDRVRAALDSVQGAGDYPKMIRVEVDQLDPYSAHMTCSPDCYQSEVESRTFMMGV